MSNLTPVTAGSFLDKAKEGNDKLFKRLKKEEEKVAKRARKNRNPWRDVCYQLPAGSDVQTACFGEYPMAVKNERARNLLLGNCNSMGDSAELSHNLSYICNQGKESCFVLGDDAAYWCMQCSATPKWLAVYSLGHVIQCHK